MKHKIDENLLRRHTRLSRNALSNFSIAQRMSWASKWKATREEDIAYSLLGLFDVNMAILYGEGNKAFRRLQEETIRASSDQSILAWSRIHEGWNGEILARSPSNFYRSGDVVPRVDIPQVH